MIKGGDFNARTAEKGELVWDGEEEGSRKYSKDKIMNKQGIDLLEKIEKMELGLLNGNKEGDDQGEWTFTEAKGSSVIDYVICNAETWEEIKSFRIGERIESDYQPLEIELKATTEETRNIEEVKKIEIEDQTEEGIKIYQENLKKRKEKEEIQEEWEELAEEIRKAINKKKVKNKTQNVGKKSWWNKAETAK